MWPKLRWTCDRLGMYLLVCRIGKFHASIFKHTEITEDKCNSSYR